MQSRMRHGLLYRATAVMLSWVFLASTAWAAAPPVRASQTAPAGAGVRLQLLPLPTALTAASLGAMQSALATVKGHAPVPAPAPSSRVHGQPGGAIEPMCDCVRDNKDGTFTAFFGYRNNNRDKIALPDVDSRFEGGHRHDGRCQHAPTFHPGESRKWKHRLGVIFRGPEVWWVLRGPDGAERRAKASRHSPRCGPPPTQPSEDCTPFFGPKQYIRTTGPKNVYTETISVPAEYVSASSQARAKHRCHGLHHWPGCRCPLHLKHKPRHAQHRLCTKTWHKPHDCKGEQHRCPGNDHKCDFPESATASVRLRVRNGEPDGSFRVSSAWIYINGVEVVHPSDLNPQVAGLELPVTLTAMTELKVIVAGKPGTYLVIDLCGVGEPPSGDTTPPTLTWAAPTDGANTNDTTPMLRVQYADAPGAGETEASGVNVTTLKVFLDDVDQTALFTKLSDEASAELPDSLALSEGTHNLLAQVQDVAGNSAEARVTFRVDTKPPTITIAQPTSGAVLRTLTVDLLVRYQDDIGLDLATLAVAIDASDVTGLLNKAAGEASGTASPGEGAHTMSAMIRDLAGNVGTAVPSSFRIDVTAPTLTLEQPTCDGSVASTTPEIIVTYSDASGIDLASLSVTVDGDAVAMTAGADRASGQTATLTSGLHALAARVRDAAGNETVVPQPPATCTFRVDTAVPHITISAPEAGSFTNAADIPVQVDYWDDDGIDTWTLRVLIGGVDRTAEFTVGPTQATAAIAGLADGVIPIEASVQDWAGKSAAASLSFTIDRLVPTVAVELPEALVPVKSPTGRVVYDGTGTAIVTAKVEIWLDGANVTGLFALSASEAVATLAELAEGMHTLRAVVFDQANNTAETTREFRVDMMAPTTVFAAPPSFTNDTTPAIRLTYADESGSGVDVSKVRVWLSSGPIPPGGEPPAEREITALCTAEVAETTCTLPDDQALEDGPQRLRVEVVDMAGHIGAASVAFEVDTVEPTYAVETPVGGDFISTSTPSLLVFYQDDRSGVDPETVTVVVGGFDLAPHLLREQAQASGTVPPDAALPQGKQDVLVTLSDRAGNAAEPMPHFFVVDTKAPTVALELPVNGSRLGASKVPVATRAAYQDENSGAGNAVVTSSVQVLVDGVNRASELSVGAAVVEGALALPDGPHTMIVRVEDRAKNQASAQADFVVDTVAPDVTDPNPPDNDYINSVERNPDGTVHITGHVQDVDSTVSVTCRVGTTSVSAAISGNTFACDVPVVDGANTVYIEAADSAGNVNTSEEPLDLFVDVNSPQVDITSPTEGSYTRALALPVSVDVRDASPVTVSVNGRPAGCVEGPPLPEQGLRQWSCQASDVPIGPGPTQALEAIAVDAAGNAPSRDTVSVIVDRVAPTVTITSPSAGACVAGGGTIDVTGTAEDATSPIANVTVNGVPATGCAPLEKRCDFTVTVAVGNGVVSAVATDRAGNQTDPPATVTVTPDAEVPRITIDAPAPGLRTNAATVQVTGTITDTSGFTATIGIVGGDALPLPVAADGAFAYDLPLPPGETEQDVVIDVSAKDCAHPATHQTRAVTLDRKAPVIDIVAPSDGALLHEASVVVAGTVDDTQAKVQVRTTVEPGAVDAVVTGNAWTATVTSLAEGPNPIIATATDAAANASAASISVTVDLGPPVVTITAPTSGLIVTDPLIEVTGTVTDSSAREVLVKGRVAAIAATPAGTDGAGRDYYNCAAGCEYTATGVLLDPGRNVVTATATDTRDNTGSASVSVTYDAAPPAVELMAPESISLSRGGVAEASVTDDVGVAEVVFVWNGATLATFTAEPYTVDLVAPAGAKAGDTITLSVTARDVAGRATTVERGVRVAAEGVVVGQALDDRTSLPLAGVTARLVSRPSCVEGAAAGCTSTSDSTGRYSLPVSEARAVVSLSSGDFTSVERDVAVELGVGTVPVDGRLTALAAAQTVGAGGGALTAKDLSVTVPAGAVTVDTPLQLTGLTPQGLPGLLPLGFSPVAAFDLRVAESVTPAPVVGGPLAVTLSLPCVVTAADTGECTARWTPPAGGLHLVEYRASTHGWYMVARAVAVAEGTATYSLPGVGAYALVVADSGDVTPALPAVGDPLTGVAFAAVPTAATSTGGVDPSVVPPSGGTAAGWVTVDSPATPIPSGTVVQAEVTETYDLVTNETASREMRRMDIVLYREVCRCAAGACAASTLCAQVPVTPAMTFENAQLLKGRVLLDVLAGREGVRGVTGGNAPAVVRVPGMETSLSVAAGALPEETAIQVEQVPAAERSSFVYASDQIEPLAEVVIDLAGRTLAIPAELRVSGANAVDGDSFLLVKVERLAGVPRLVAAGVGALLNDTEGLRFVSQAGFGLPGIVEGGRYVMYRIAASQPIGFASGSATSGGAGSAALVRVASPAGWPFVTMSRPLAGFVLAAPAGAIDLRATVPGTSLVGTVSTTVPQNAAVEGVVIALAGTATTAEVTPANDAVNVELSAPLAIAASAAIDPASATSATIRLFRGEDESGTPVALRFVLSGGGRQLSVIPYVPPPDPPTDAPLPAPLDFSSRYTLIVTGLTDVYGAPIAVPPTRFRTKDDVPPFYDPNRLVFTYSDAERTIHVTAAACSDPGCFYPGSEILIVDATNGIVTWLQAGEGGAVNDFFPGTLNDVLIVTITDPFGHSTTFTRSQYAIEGSSESAIGVGGGVVRGEGGLELRIPEGALDKAVRFTIEPVGQEYFPTLPPMNWDGTGEPPAHFGSGLKVNASEPVRFKKEAKLAFPVPDFSSLPPDQRPSSPDKAFYYVFAKNEGPCPAPATTCDPSERPVLGYRTIDYARVEHGEDGQTRIVTASYPFCGFDGLSMSYSIVMMQFSIIMSEVAVPLGGAITGRVTQALPDGSGYAGLAGRTVWVSKDGDVVRGSGEMTANTDGDGNYTIQDHRFYMGNYEVSTIGDNGQTYRAQAYATANMKNDPGWMGLFRAGYRNIAVANITLPPPPPEVPAPSIDIKLFTYDEAAPPEQRRTQVDGYVVVGVPLLMTFTLASEEQQITGVSIDGQMQEFQVDPQDKTGRTVMLSKLYMPDGLGTHTVEATALPAFGPPVVERTVFRVIASAGAEIDPIPGPPRVVDSRSKPKEGAENVPVNTTLVVAFSEPVTNVLGNVHLLAGEHELPIILSGVSNDGVVVKPGEMTATSVVTSLTIEPEWGLYYDQKHELRLGSGIVDLDSLVGTPLEPYVLTFTTFKPEELEGTPDYYKRQADVVVLGDRAYIAEVTAYGLGRGDGILRSYDISNPGRIEPIGQGEHIYFPPWAMAGEDREGARRLAVACGSRSALGISTPGNVLFYDIDSADGSEKPVWRGGVSVTQNVMDGTARRIVLKDGMAYVATIRKGLQVVDTDQAVAQFPTDYEEQMKHYRQMTTQPGYLTESVITIPFKDGLNPHYSFMRDLAVEDVVTGEGEARLSQRLIFAVGNALAPKPEDREKLGLMIANPITMEVLYQKYIRSASQIPGSDETMIVDMPYPESVTMARLGARLYALIAGYGTYADGTESATGSILVAIDVTDPYVPVVRAGLGLVSELPQGVGEVDVAADGTIVVSGGPEGGESGTGPAALVGGLNTLPGEKPRLFLVGTIAGVGSRIALSNDGYIYSTEESYVRGETTLGGMRVTRLNPRCILLDVVTDRVVRSGVIDTLNKQFCGQTPPLVFRLCRAATVSLNIDGHDVAGTLDGQPIASFNDIPLAEGRHTFDFDAGVLDLLLGMDGERPFFMRAINIEEPDDVVERTGTVASLVANRSVLPVGHTFVKGVDLLDGHVVRGGTDVKIKGRHLGLEVARTYSSTSKKRNGVVGANWEWNLASRVIPSACGTTVITMDGSSQQFHTSDNGQTFTPQRGYHTKLELKDGVYIFTDKAGIKHHFKTFRAEEILGAGLQTDYPLDFVEEPHGDKLVWVYDEQGRLKEVDEWHPDESVVRRLLITYTRMGGYPRVDTVTVEGLGSSVGYVYDSVGNLKEVYRSAGGTLPVSTKETFEYSAEDPTDPHQLIAAVDVNRARTEYEYYTDEDTLPGENVDWLHGNIFILPGKRELAKIVREFPGNGMPIVETKFTYDRSQGQGSEPRFVTVVKDGRGNDTTYTLNSDGSPLQIDEPEGRTTKMWWHDDDIYKDRELDANGRVTEYKYEDGRGNLTREIIHTSDLGDAETVYEYDTKCNKLKHKRDAEGYETSYTIDDKCDVRHVYDAAGNHTEHQYDGHGRLYLTIDPRRYTITYGGWDTYGNASTISGPGDYTASRAHDKWGRLQEETDSRGHVTATTYDGLDRIRRLAREGGLNSAPYWKTTEYYPAGQVDTEQVQSGLWTHYTLDGMNRVVEARTVYGTRKEFTIKTSYDGNGNKLTENDARGVQRSFTYYGTNLLKTVTIMGGPSVVGPTGLQFAYGYDLVGNKISEIAYPAGLETTFVPDGLYRTKTKRFPGVPGTDGGSASYYEEYTYDKVGNRRAFRDANGNTTRYGYDGLGRVTSVTNALNQTTTMEYNDREGGHVNKTMEYDGTRGLRTRYEHDAQNRETLRTVSLEGAGGDGAEYVTKTDYNGTRVHIEGPDGHITDQELNGRDRVARETITTRDGSLVTTTYYDGQDQPLVVTDPRKSTSYRRDGYGRVIWLYDSRYTAEYDYDATGLKLSEKDKRGIVRNHEYDNLGRQTYVGIVPSITGVDWRQDTGYDDAALTRTERDAKGRATVHQLDAMGRVLSSRDARDQTILYTYDGVNKRSQSDKRHNVTRFDYDKINRLVRTTDPPPFDGQTVEITYDTPQNQRIEKDRRGYVTIRQLDPLGRVKTVTRDGPGMDTPVVLERNGYDAYGNKTLAVDGEGRQTRFRYDGANRLIVRTDGYGSDVEADTSFQYLGSGATVLERDKRAADDGLTFSTKRLYDYMNRLQHVIDALNHVTYYGYDGEGNRTVVQEPLGQRTEFDYDELGKLILVTQPAPETGQPTPITEYRYDENRNRKWQFDGNEHAVYMDYDELNRLTKTVQDPTGMALTTEITEYDPDGNVIELVDPKGQTITSQYDELSRVKSKSFAFAPGDPYRPWRYLTSVGYHYDANSNLERVEEAWAASGSDPPPARTTHRVWDGFNRLQQERIEEAGAPETSVAYTYYNNGTRKTVDTNGLVTHYTYDGRNRLASATAAYGTPDARPTTYQYWPDDLLKEVRCPNGVTAGHGYDSADRLKSISNQRGTTVISSYSYGYDNNGNRTSQTEVNGGRTETTGYGYDNLNRLKRITYPVDEQYPNGHVVTYSYDNVGNRIGEVVTARPVGGTPTTLSSKIAVFDAINRLRTVTDSVDASQNATFEYDDNGNQTAKIAAGGRTDYRYDVRDKMVEAVQADQVLGLYQFDFDGRRTFKSGEVGTTAEDNVRRYVYDQTSILAEYNADYALVARYDYGSDRLISLTSAYEGRRYYLFDGLRSVTNLTNDSGATAASYHLDAWGNFRFPTEIDASQNRFAFTGYQWDIATGLYNAKARFYDPLYGRFTSQDSFLGKAENPPSLHRYFYGNANPTRYVDDDGEASLSVHSDVTYKAVLREARRLGLDSKQTAQLMRGAMEGAYLPDVPSQTPGWIRGGAVGRADTEAMRLRIAAQPLIDLKERWVDRRVDWAVQGVRSTARVLKEAWTNAEINYYAGDLAGYAFGLRSWWRHSPPVSKAALVFAAERIGDKIPFLEDMRQTHYGNKVWQHAMGRTGQTASEVQSSLLEAVKGNMTGYHKAMAAGDLYGAGVRLGTSLHYLQDTYTPSHCYRDPQTGKIQVFYNFDAQSSIYHELGDEPGPYQRDPEAYYKRALWGDRPASSDPDENEEMIQQSQRMIRGFQRNNRADVEAQFAITEDDPTTEKNEAATVGGHGGYQEGYIRPSDVARDTLDWIPDELHGDDVRRRTDPVLDRLRKREW